MVFIDLCDCAVQLNNTAADQRQDLRSRCGTLGDRVRDILGTLATTRYEDAVGVGGYGGEFGMPLKEKAVGTKAASAPG